MRNRNPFKICLELLLILVSFPTSVAMAQDLFDRQKRGPSSPEAIQIRESDRSLYTSVSPDLDLVPISESRRSSRVGANLEFDSDFACGNFNLRSNLEHLLSKEYRDDLLSTLLKSGETALTANALEFFCRMSPTACAVFKHHRANIGFALLASLDRCRAFDTVLQNDTMRAKASLTKDCMQRLVKENPDIPLDVAYEKCLNSDEIRNFTGEFVKEILLVEDISKYFELDSSRKADLEKVFGNTKVTSKGISGQPSLAEAAGALYDEARSKYVRVWTESFDLASRGQPISREILDRLAPLGARLSEDEFRKLAVLPDWKREILVRTLGSLFAYYDTLLKIADIESLLSELEAEAKSGVLKEKLARDRIRLAEERKRLALQFEGAKEIQKALLAADDIAESHAAIILHNKVKSLEQNIETERIKNEYGAPWGRKKAKADSSRPAPLSSASSVCCQGDGSFRGGVYK